MGCYHGITQGHLGIFDDLVNQGSGGLPLGWCHDEGGVEARMLMAWVPGCRSMAYTCSKAPRGSLRIIVVRGGCPVPVRIEAFMA